MVYCAFGRVCHKLPNASWCLCCRYLKTFVVVYYTYNKFLCPNSLIVFLLSILYSCRYGMFQNKGKQLIDGKVVSGVSMAKKVYFVQKNLRVHS
jgi:hypothetical protein